MSRGSNGGPRPGAGRKKGGKNVATLTKEQARIALAQIVMAHMEDLVSAQIAQAKGIKYLVARQKTTGKFVRLTREIAEKVITGEDDQYALVEVWEKDPSTPAFTDLMNRALDKPKEQEQEIRLTGEISVVAIRLSAARKRLAERASG